MSQLVVCNGIFVVWSCFPITTAEAWKYVRYPDQREFLGTESIRVFPADSEESAQILANILA
jgi:hypothetical protein